MSSRETELGTLIIVVLKARNLNDKHSFYKQDVFAQVTLNGTTKKTKLAVRGGQHPEWDEEIRYSVMKQSGDKFRKLEVACYAKEPRSDDILGKGEVDITDTLKTGEFDDWVPLNVDGVVRGDLYLEMTFYSNSPAPTPPPSAPSHAALSSNSQRRPSNVERINRPQADPQPGASTRPLQPGRHQSGSLAPEHHHSINQSRPAQHTSIPPVSDRLATAALHNLLSDPVMGQRPNAHYSSKGHSRSSSASSSKPADSPLPTLPREATPPAGLPSTLLPGGGRRVVSSPNPSQHIPTHSQQSFTGSAGSIPHYNNISVSSSQAYAPRPTPYHTTGNTQLTPGQTQTYSPPSFAVNLTTAQPPYGAPVPTASPHWRPEAAPTESFSFPIPMPHAPAPGDFNGHENYAPPPVRASYIYTPPPAGYDAPAPQAAYPLPPPKSGYLQSSYTPPPQPTSHDWKQPSLQNIFSDPFLQTRYSTPLSLPPGSDSPPRGQESVSFSTATKFDQTRIEALRQVEKEAERQKTQEERDHELALALDRELNLEAESTSTPTVARNDSEMPGRWPSGR